MSVLPRPSTLRALRFLAVATAAFVLTCGAAAGASATAVVDAGPRVAPGDGRSTDGYAVTFSPDGDGRGDVVHVDVRARPGDRIRLVVSEGRSLGTSTIVARGPRATVPRSGRVRLRWNGHGAAGLLSDGPYVARACSEDGACAAQPIAVHLRVLAAYIDADTGFAPGALVPLVVLSERATVTIGIGADDARPEDAVRDAVSRSPGRMTYRLPPDLRPGLHRLIVTTGSRSGWRALPLLVHPPDLAHPAAGTTLIVMPYLTWSVYNEHDGDRDGRPDSHYETPASRTTLLRAPYETAGLAAPGTAGREQDATHTDGFMRTWRLLGGAERLPAAFVTDVQLERMGDATVRRYSSVLFLGHTEYYTRRLFERVRAYQLGGGDFLYASANGFYALVDVRGGGVRLLARPQRSPQLNDALVTGVQYTGCCWSVGSPGPLRVTAAGLRRAPWAFRGTGLQAGDVLAYAGGEIDGFGPQSPVGMTVLAELDWRAPDRPVQSAAMVLIDRPGGGRVFSPGTMGFVDGTARNARVRRLFGNVWTRFADPTR